MKSQHSNAVPLQQMWFKYMKTAVNKISTLAAKDEVRSTSEAVSV
ncbi:hypothetical protein [Nostoc sp. UHCC 0252]|nr:hypothetical protein [Nostoc sp. UHCC 0252]MEA5600687.1 hypothetical protein [Nostoc sp. UHCC 0252]